MKNISISFTLKSLLMGAFLGLFFTSFLPTKAYAATAEWKDNFNLTFEGDTYQSDNNDDNWYFYRLSDPDGCPDIINDISWSPRGAGDKTDDPSDDDTTAKLQKRSNTAVGCQDDGDKIDIDLSGHANATTGLVWDGEFIKETSDSPHVFQYDESIDAYVRQGDNSCQDSMVTNVGSGTATITLSLIHI